jgi:adenylate cyclase
MILKRKSLDELKSYLFLGVKFGIAGSLIGFILHAIWGNLEDIKYSVFNGFFIGFFIGFFELIFSNPKIVQFPYSLILLIRTITYFVLTLISIYTFLVIYLRNIGLTIKALADPQKFQEIKGIYFLTNINTIYILIIIMAATFLWQLKAHFGKGVLSNYISGRYHRPSIENRILMFLDLNDPTTLAEKLGSKKYSMLLADFFRDIDSAFTNSKGRVFQYVGDEVVVIWKMKEGLRNNNCINAFFLAASIFEAKKAYYIKKYKITPSFKASLHLGEVTITEIGVSKREIVYHGDTMNTTSRLCSSAHKLGKNILISKTLHDRLNKNNDIVFEDLGEHSLKGKDENIHIYGI